MAPKNRNAQNTAPAVPVTSSTSTVPTTASTVPVQTSTIPSTPSKISTKPSTKSSSNQSPQEIALSIWQNYVDNTPQRTKLIDIFMGFLVVVGVLQFVYCILNGNFPFNAFLSGFSATVGQFVLTASLRMQTSTENKDEFASVSPERAFADYVFGSLILHFFCVNFIN